MRKTHCDLAECEATILTDELEGSNWLAVTRYPLYRMISEGNETEFHLCSPQHLASWSAERVLADKS